MQSKAPFLIFGIKRAGESGSKLCFPARTTALPICRYRILVIAVDNCEPSTSATQSITVIVRDTLSDFLVTSGSPNGSPNARGSVCGLSP